MPSPKSKRKQAMKSKMTVVVVRIEGTDADMQRLLKGDTFLRLTPTKGSRV